MKRYGLLMALFLGLNACATINLGDSGFIYRRNQEKKLEAAVSLQKEGKITSAVEAYKAICSDRGLEGVTDQALFRLSILYLDFGLGSDMEFIQVAQQNFERLRKEYPSSSWSVMASPVSDLLANFAELRRQNANIKNQNQSITKENQSLAKENQSLAKENQSLAKENQELKESIEKLKRLDLELEQKRK